MRWFWDARTFEVLWATHLLCGKYGNINEMLVLAEAGQ